MSTNATPQTFARTITVCAECGEECQWIAPDEGDRWTIFPCGHYSALKAIQNPKLPRA